METKIRKPAELVSPQTIKMLIYGQPGIGKSTLGLSTPSPLLLDFDGGVHRINPLHQTDTVQVTCWEDCVAVLKEDLSAYKSLVIDTAGKMLDYMSAYIIKGDPKMGRKDGALSLQGYGIRKTMFVNFLRQVSIMGKNLVFIAHDREERDGDNKIIRPEIGGSSAGDLIKEIDLVGYMEASGKKRTISFDPCEKFYGKNTCSLPSVINVPEVATQRNTFLLGIISQYHESLEKRKEIGIQYSHLIGEIKRTIEEVKTAEEANKTVVALMALEPIWDSKLQAAEMMKVKAAELALTFDKTKRYV